MHGWEYNFPSVLFMINVKGYTQLFIKVITVFVTLIYCSACSDPNSEKVDHLNTLSYSFHYRSLDSTQVYARRAYQLSDDYSSGRAEALNNLAFVSIARMDYTTASNQLQEIQSLTDNQVELLISDIQMMRLCQRQSENKDFYNYEIFMNQNGVSSPWEEENIFLTPYYENEL